MADIFVVKNECSKIKLPVVKSLLFRLLSVALGKLLFLPESQAMDNDSSYPIG